MQDQAVEKYLKLEELEEPGFGANALKILEKRYLRRDHLGQITEDAKGMLARVAANIADVDQRVYQKDRLETASLAQAFYQMMARNEFLPNSPTLMNAGTPIEQLAACFVLPVEDDLEQIFESLKHTAMVHKSGGGTGFSFSRIRPKNDIVASTGGEASGPISFMRIFNAATEEVKQGGKRRGANMGILRVDHPDILAFISCKDDQKQLNNFNISVALTDEFMQALLEKRSYKLINPKDHSVTGQLEAVSVFERLVHQAWKNGEPGVIFIDRINQDNPTPQLGEIESTNPCGEQPLLAYESCNLGSLNLEKFVVDGEFDYEHLRQIIRLAIHFLDNVIDANRYPLPQIAELTRANRKIGLGVMGWANALILLGIPYNSEEAIAKAQEVMAFLEETAKAYSRELAIERGAFTHFSGSLYDRRGEAPLRNATVTTIAPTGTISMLANTSSGIEPLFGVVYQSKRADSTFLELNAMFEKIARQRGFWSEDLPEKILAAGTLQGVDSIPEDVQRVFVTSGEIEVQYHIRMQAAFQAFCDNAVSKTINFAHEATEADIHAAFLQAYELGCKGLTVYRDGSRDSQVLNKGTQTSSGEPSRIQESIHPQARPKMMAGISSEYHSACSNFYVTVNGNDGQPFEVFCNSVGQGGCQAQITAVATLTSLLLRCHVAVEEIIMRLKRIQCPACIRREGIDVPSCPAAIGQALEIYQQKHTDGSAPPVEQLVLPFLETADQICPECGSPLTHQEGCRSCSNPSCSYSYCG